MHRASIIRLAMWAGVAFLLSPSATHAAESRPNVLFIAVDDLRPELACYGAEHIQSPNIDRLAASGLRFDRAYCQQAVCNPSRTSLMTGLRPDTIGVTGNHSHFRSKMPTVVTLPQHFKQHGYHAAAIGKLYHGVFPDGASNTKWDTMGDPQSWSVPAIRFGPRYYYTEEGIAAAKETFAQVYKPKNPGPHAWAQKLVFGPATESPDVEDNVLYDGQVADSAVATLRDLHRKPDQPFFLAVGFIKPHSPYIAPKKYFDLYDDVDIASGQILPQGAPGLAGHGSGELRRYTDQPKRGEISEDKQRRVRHAYYACVSYIDAQIGRILDELDRLGLSDNTIVSLYGDHGYHLGEQGLWGKTTNFELDTRVPLIICAPGMKATGKTSYSLVELVDLYPTLADLAGLPIGDHLEGKSLARLLDDPMQSVKDAAFSQYPRGGLMGYSMRTATHRLTRWVDRQTGKVEETELYDYTDGLIEEKNVAEDAKDLTRELAARFTAISPISLQPTQRSEAGKRIKVACVGDSITYGYGIRNRDTNSFPALLQQMLGDGYEVGNFGYSGATLLKNGHKPYWEKAPFLESLEFQPDVVVINLGANDAVDTNWAHASQFAADYNALIAKFRSLPSKPAVHICEILPIFPKHDRYRECMTNRKTMTSMIRQVAKSSKSEMIDLHSPFADKNAMFPDGLHPNETGTQLMAQRVFTALTGKQPPVVEVSPPPHRGATNGTGFEDQKAGRFTTIDTKIGKWTATSGTALINDRYATTGRQCLQLPGGKESTVELEIADDTSTSGNLSFRAERWTKRDPFSFRISKRSGEKWTQIYNGDNEIRVGRPFLSAVDVALDDPNIDRLRFTVVSPSNTGILIDDLRIAPAQPQRITRIEVVPFALPALIGAEHSPLLKLKIETSGRINPISITKVQASLNGTTDLSDIATLQGFYGGSNGSFAADTAFGAESKPTEQVTFSGKQILAEGANYVWVACKLKDSANIDHFVGAVCEALEFSNGKSVDFQSTPSIQNMGVSVRDAGDDGVHTYRIPGLATTKKGSLIAVYDVRRRSGGDLPGDIDVGMSRSTDGGRTWEPMKVIMDMGDAPDFRYDGIGDPTVMVDKTTGTVWCGATWSHGNRSWFGSQPGLEPVDTGQFMLVRSDDDGVTWSKPINITRQVKKPEWSFLLQGPGKGITMSDGTIVMPAQYQDPPHPTDKRANRLPHSTFIYSRDHGKTWKTATGAWDDTTEAQVVELAEGQLMINCRNNQLARRAIMTTSDMGKTWQEHASHNQALIEPGACMASLINVGRELRLLGAKGENSDRDDFLLFSNPDSLRGRNHITIKASLDGGKTWPASHHLLLDEQNGRGYSCLTMIDSKTVGILYEGSQAHMTFQRVKLADILNPPKNQKTKNPAQIEPAVSNAAASGEPAKQEIGLARVFGDHMVLQAAQPIRVWGHAKPGADVSVKLGTASAITKAGTKGRWQVSFSAQKYNKNPQTLTATSGHRTHSISDILIGEVWLCAGQSNMEWPLSQSTGGKEAVAGSTDSQLRLMNFVGAARGGSGVYTEAMMARMTPDKFSTGTWEVAGLSSSPKFSAVGYFFAQQLRKKLNCPVGVINVSIGGTPIEAWVDSRMLAEHATLSKMVDGNWLDNPDLDEWCKTRARSNLKRALSGELAAPRDEFGPNHSFKPGFMYEAGVKPFTPMSIRGMLWYQGESNGDNPARTRQYDAAFPLLVSSWRNAFQNKDMPVAFVQLPAMGRSNWPIFREYQRRSLARLRNVGMAVTIDTGDQRNVHPGAKQPVGQRLAQWALATTYGQQGPAMGPLYRSKTVDGGTLIVSFDTNSDRLITDEDAALNNFEIAGTDGIFHPATASISGSEVRVSSPRVPMPKNARYAWSDFPNPKPNLFNSTGIPASPFTTEDSVPDGEAVAADDRPNILFIVSEDNSEHLGCYGEQRVHTPHLDALAAGGIRYTRAYVPYSVCSPSRAAFLTGLYTRQTGHIGLATHRFSMYRDFKTMPARFKQAGYYTGFLGKTHINPERLVEDHVDHRAIRNSNFGKTISIETYAEEAGAVMQKAADFEKPFLLIINYADAHRKFVRKSKNGFPTRLVDDDIAPFPWIGSDSPHLREELRDYFNCMNRLDEGVGMVLNKLETAGVRDNTLIVYISDHGADFPRGKGSIYENGTRIPMIVNDPRSFSKGKVENGMVSTIDILPTMLRAAQIPVPRHLPGVELQDIDSGKVPPRKHIHTFTTGSSPNLLYMQFGIRDERYKLVYNPDRALNRLGESRYKNSSLPEDQHVQSFLYPPEYELFDLQEDPHEWKNLADVAEHQDIRQRLLKAMQDFQREIKDPFASKQNVDTFIAEQKEYLHKPYKKSGFRWPHLDLFEEAQQADNARASSQIIFQQRDIPEGVPRDGHSKDATKYGYRIPSLLVTKKGSLLAFSERRLGLHDHAQNDIVLKRSTDHGRTWSDEIVAYEDGMNSINDPLTVQLENGRILLMFARFPYGRHARDAGWIKMADLGYDDPSANVLTFICHSDDDGKTWSKPVDISRQVKHPKLLNANTPGAMIQLTKGPHKGRVVTGLWGTLPIMKDGKRSREWQVVAAFSDDNGKSWKRTEPLIDESGKGFPNECQVAEAANGDVVLISRNQGGDAFRKKAISSDGGETWSALRIDRTLPSVACMGSLIRGPVSKDGTWDLWASFPSNAGRKDGQVAVSKDNGKTWRTVKVISGPFAYSALQISPDQKSLLCLYESGGYRAETLLTIPFDEVGDHKQEQQQPKALGRNR